MYKTEPLINEKQKLFAAEFATSHNATDAAAKAGYSEHSAKVIGCQLLKKPHIQREIERLCDHRREKCDIEAGEIIQKLREFAFAPEHVRISNADRIRTLELLGKTCGLFVDRAVIQTEPVLQMDQDEIEQVLEEARTLKRAIGRGNTKLFIQPESEFDNE